MTKSWFEYKGINSLDMHMYIENDIVFPSPEADIEFIEVLGRDGELAIDNERLKSVSFSFPVRIKLPKNKDINQISTEISNWLKSNIGWHPLKFSGSPEYEYIAIIYEQFGIEETLRQYGKSVITFRLKPYKRKINTKPIILTNGATLVNIGMRKSKPLINITGSGNISLKNNGEDWLTLRSVDQRITIDSELMIVYKDNIPQYAKVVDLKGFPILNEGHNKITWSGNISKLEIDPRWEAIV